MNPRHAAQYAAQHGRYGDTELVHVNKDELRGLAALSPRGRLSTNPQTGYPEAFDLGTGLGILGSIGGILAAPFTGGMSLALTGAIGGGLGTFLGNMIEGKDVGTSAGKGLLSGILGYGLGGAAEGLMEPAAEAAVPAATSAAATAAPAAIAAPAASAGGDGIASLLASGATDASAAAGGIGAGAGAGAGMYPTMAPGIEGATLAPSGPYALGAPGTGSTTPMPAASFGDRVMGGVRNIGQGFSNPGRVFDTFGKNALSTTVPIAAGAYGLSQPDYQYGAPPPQQGYQTYPTLRPNAQRGPYTPPPADYDYSTGKAWNYYPNAYAEGGGIDMRRLRPPMTPDYRNMRPSYLDDRFMDRQASDEADIAAGMMDDPNAPRRYDLSSPSPFDREQAPTVRFDDGGEVNYGDMFEQADMGRIQRRQTQNYGRAATERQIGNNEFGIAREGAAAQNRRRENDMREEMSPEEILQEQVMAQQMQQRYTDFNRGYRPPPGGVPGYARGGGVSGPGDGLSDTIPAIINSRKPAALSSGEYVVPAHAVSALGNGSTEAGTGQLDNMVSNVMMQKYGTTNRKPRPVNAGRALGGLASGRRPFAEGGEVQMALAGDRYTDPTTNETYESAGNVPVPMDEKGYAVEGYMGKMPWQWLPGNHNHEGGEDGYKSLGQGKYFRTIPPRSWEEWERKGKPEKGYPGLELFKRIDPGFPTS